MRCIGLDNTLWNGVLLESPNVELKPEIPGIIKTLDSRGILNSIASKNDYNEAIKKFKLAEYFLYPEIHWNAKSSSIESIQKNLNIGMDSILFIDDQDFELENTRQTLV